MTTSDVEDAARLVSGDASSLLPQGERTIEEERLHRKQNLAAAFRLFSRFGFDEGVAGHITARDPELTDHFWVNPFGMHFGHIRVSDLLLVRHDGTIVQGDRPLNQAAFAIHSQVHAARGGINYISDMYRPIMPAWWVEISWLPRNGEEPNGVGYCLMVKSQIRPATLLMIEYSAMKPATWVSTGALASGLNSRRSITMPPINEKISVSTKAPQ